MYSKVKAVTLHQIHESKVTDFLKQVSEYIYITAWAVALSCYISHSAMHRKKADFDPPGGQNP